MFAKRVSAAHSSASAGPMGLEPGTQLGNHRVLFCTARGGMASVWPALQLGPRGFSKLVALKAILPDLVASPEFEALFIEEARIAARIRHPNVCEVFELIEENGVLALSMEWIDGDALGRVLGTPPQPLKPRIAAYIVAQAAAGLHAAHELRDDAGDAMNVVHRDVSSQNILISKDGHVKISDFGIAKAFGSTRDATQAGRVRGKLAYMSPEQASAAATDRRSDVFSLGVVLYQITVGQIPFRQADDTTRTHLTRLLEGAYRSPRELYPDYPIELEQIVSRALSRDPAQRYPSADAMRLALEGWLARSGPPVNERDLARVVRERRGGEIAARELKIRTLSEIACLPRGAHTGKTLEPIALGPEPVTWTERLAPRPRASRIWLLAGGAALFTLSLVIRARIVGSEAESAHAGTTSIRSDAAPPARDVRPAPPLALSAVPPPERNVTPPAGTEAEKPRLKRAPQAVKASAATLRAPMPPKRESARPTPNPRTKPTLGPLEREL